MALDFNAMYAQQLAQQLAQRRQVKCATEDPRTPLFLQVDFELGKLEGIEDVFYFPQFVDQKVASRLQRQAELHGWTQLPKREHLLNCWDSETSLVF